MDKDKNYSIYDLEVSASLMYPIIGVLIPKTAWDRKQTGDEAIRIVKCLNLILRLILCCLTLPRSRD